MQIRDYTDFRADEILPLYEAAGWVNYTRRSGRLAEAFRRSLCVLAAWEDGRPVGILRAVGDGVTVVFIQDILVLPEYQRRGIGSALLRTLLERYRDVYQIQLLTDDAEKTKAFYRANGFRSADAMGCLAFVRMRTDETPGDVPKL